MVYAIATDAFDNTRSIIHIAIHFLSGYHYLVRNNVIYIVSIRTTLNRIFNVVFNEINRIIEIIEHEFLA